MNSIWANTFYNTQPALAWLYRLDLSSFYNGVIDKAYILSQAVADISIGKRESNYTDVYYGGVKRKIFTRAENTGEFSIKFNEDKYYTVSTILENMYTMFNMNQYYPSSIGETAYNSNSIPDEQRIIRVNAYDPRHFTETVDPEFHDIQVEHNIEFPLLQWEFYGCQLVSLDEMPFSYESTESITRTATFCYQYMVFRNRETLANENNGKKAELKTQMQEEQTQRNTQERANRENYDKLYPDNGGNAMNQTMYGSNGGARGRGGPTGPRR